jgi:beta-glucanase (GH16 family)
VSWKLVGAATAVAVGVGAVTMVATQSDNATAAPAVASSYHLVWQDNFSGSKLSGAWLQHPTSAAAGRSCATVSPKMSTVKGGIASFAAAVNKSKGKTRTCPTSYLNSQVVSAPSWLYGKFEARIKLQAPQGMHSSFWMLPTGAVAPGVSAADLPGSRGVEVDVAEYFGDAFKKKGDPKSGLYSFVYWPKRSGTMVKTQGNTAKATKVVGKKKASGGYHTFAVEWTPTAYIFSIDGVQTAKITQGISHRAESMLFSMLTSDWELPKMKKSTLPASMKVDWVRVYQK